MCSLGASSSSTKIIKFVFAVIFIYQYEYRLFQTLHISCIFIFLKPAECQAVYCISPKIHGAGQKNFSQINSHPYMFIYI